MADLEQRLKAMFDMVNRYDIFHELEDFAFKKVDLSPHLPLLLEALDTAKAREARWGAMELIARLQPPTLDALPRLIQALGDSIDSERAARTIAEILLALRPYPELLALARRHLGDAERDALAALSFSPDDLQMRYLEYRAKFSEPSFSRLPNTVELPWTGALARKIRWAFRHRQLELPPGSESLLAQLEAIQDAHFTHQGLEHVAWSEERLTKVEVLARVEDLLATFGKSKPEIRHIYLYGSYRFSNAKPDSDIDVAVELKDKSWPTARATWLAQRDAWSAELQAQLPNQLDLQLYFDSVRTPEVYRAIKQGHNLCD